MAGSASGAGAANQTPAMTSGNPYPSPYGANGMMYPYRSMASGYPSEGYPGQGQMTTTPDTEASSPTDQRQTDVAMILAASGVPNHAGRLTWPVGLRVLMAPKAEELREQIENLFRLAALQAVRGQPNDTLLRILKRDVDKLRAELRHDQRQGYPLPLAVYQDAEHFLRQLKEAPEVLQVRLAPEEAEKAGEKDSRSY
jgi:hypothetical protein